MHEQVQDLAKTSIIQNAWARKQDIHLHGWVYGINNGIIKDLDITLKDNNSLEAVDQVGV